MITAIKNELIASKVLYKAIVNAAKDGEYSYFTRKPIPKNTVVQLLSFGYDLYIRKYDDSYIIRWNDSKGIIYLQKDCYSNYQPTSLDEVYR